MSVREKRVWTQKIDKGFQELIRPLFKNEYLQLEENLMSDGCREPIAVWNDVIVDGHNRYKICTEHGIPFAVADMSFRSREEAIAWICANQLGRRKLTEESRQNSIGKQYESEKIISRKQSIYRDSREDCSRLPYETFIPEPGTRVVETRKKTAARIAEENQISHGTVEKYSLYSRAIEEIKSKEPQMAAKILSGRYKVSHNSVLTLSKRSADEIRELNKRLERSQHPFAQYQTTRQEIQRMKPKSKPDREKQPSVKDMPEFDPDAEVVGLTLTIPSWSSSIDRIVHSNLEIVSDSARERLHKALIELQESIVIMISAIKEEP